MNIHRSELGRALRYARALVEASSAARNTTTLTGPRWLVRAGAPTLRSFVPQPDWRRRVRGR